VHKTPVVVAEISGNHGGSLARARALVQAIADAGATHAKFQTYTADTITIDHDGPAFRISDEHELWGGRNLYSLYQEAHTPWEWHEELFSLSRSLGLVPFSTPFDATAVDFLETMSPELYKVASLEIGDTPLIRRIAATGRPMIMSTGTAMLSEIDEAVAAARGAGCTDLTLLLCTSSYPADPSDVHLSRMNLLRERYDVPVGLSDHTLGIGVSVAAAALGATVIERHVTMHRSDGGPDAAFSLEPGELASLVVEVSAATQSIGRPDWTEIEAEHESRRHKRSLYVVRDCAPGETLNVENVRSIRPSGGLEPKHLDAVLGKRLVRAISSGTPLTWDVIEGDEVGSVELGESTAPLAAGTQE
jgi:pseudaminic acid synthase